jgi:alginate O-acetyltransferase complex protein AlgJ
MNSAVAGGTKFVFVMAPNKESIHPEYLPPEIVKGRNRRSTQLVDFMARTSNIPILDLSEGLLANKGSGRLYH